MAFFDGPHHIGHVLNYMDQPDLVEALISKWPWKVIQFTKQIGFTSRVVIQANGARKFLDAAANIQNPPLANSFQTRHLTSVVRILQFIGN